MLIPIKGSGKTPEWVMIELQGQIISLKENETISEIGTILQNTSNPDVITLTIGYHELEGRKVTLDKPLVIIDKAIEDHEETSKEVNYKVQGVVRYKYLFKTRPRALISQPQGCRVKG
mmetsp:Transcript_27925/g.51603  ORF Transcript_27925/g.51603 Transcript_27925/m.51603 type:complete len:118 (-) Transcript_27925:314-667(-)